MASPVLRITVQAMIAVQITISVAVSEQVKLGKHLFSGGWEALQAAPLSCVVLAGVAGLLC